MLISEKNDKLMWAWTIIRLLSLSCRNSLFPDAFSSFSNIFLPPFILHCSVPFVALPLLSCCLLPNVSHSASTILLLSKIRRVSRSGGIGAEIEMLLGFPATQSFQAPAQTPESSCPAWRFPNRPSRRYPTRTLPPCPPLLHRFISCGVFF